MVTMIHLIKRLIFAWRYKRAVKEAVRLQRLTGRKYFVINLDGQLKIVPKKAIRMMVATHNFKKGVKVEDIEKRALFVTK